MSESIAFRPDGSIWGAVRSGASGASRGVPRGSSAWWLARGIGFRILVPGWGQWCLGQPEQAVVLAGSFVAALVAAVLTWGSLFGFLMVAFAFLSHSVSLADALGRSIMPAPTVHARWLGVTTGLGGAIYGPFLAVATMLAWPGSGVETGADGYAVNCWAYHARRPAARDWVWYRPAPWCEPRAGQVIAGSGQAVEWRGNRLLVDGQTTQFGTGIRSARPPLDLAYRIPDGHSLVAPVGSQLDRLLVDGLVLVSHDQILGRPWAKLYPIGDRQLIR